MWALDFMYDALCYRKPFGTLNVINESNREILTIQIHISMPTARVVRTLEQLEEIHGLPKAIRLDNGANYDLRSLWAGAKKMGLNFNLSSLVNHNKMPLSSALTAPTAMKCSMHIYLKTSGRSVTLQKSGSRFTTQKDPTGLLAEYRLEITEQRQKTTL